MREYGASANERPEGYKHPPFRGYQAYPAGQDGLIAAPIIDRGHDALAGLLTSISARRRSPHCVTDVQCLPPQHDKPKSNDYRGAKWSIARLAWMSPRPTPIQQYPSQRV